MSNKPGFFRQLKDTQNYSTKFLIVLFSPNSGVTPNTPKQVVLNLISYAKHKDDAIMAKDFYEMVSDEFMYFEEKKIIEVMSKNIDRNIIKFIEI